LEDLGIGGKIILEWILGDIGWKGLSWVQLAQDRNQWWALVITVVNLHVP
jgi:hypothetical protein